MVVSPPESRLLGLVRAELTEPVQPVVTDMAAAIAAQHPGARAVLFYGSCLREQQLDGLMLDFYLIVDDYRTAYSKRWLAWANRLIPPNVFPFAYKGMAAKYAVLSEADFARECSLDASSVSVWARFAQPSRLVWSREPSVIDTVVGTVGDASITLFQRTLPVMSEFECVDVSDLDIWRKGFEMTYAAELRAERSSRPVNIVDADPARYEAFAQATLAEIAWLTGVGPDGEVPLWRSYADCASQWRWLQRKGKLLTVARLAKAAFTFSGGIDYLAWKINRHAGTQIVISDWQRRHPLLAAFTLVPKLLRQGAVR